MGDACSPSAFCCVPAGCSSALKSCAVLARTAAQEAWPLAAASWAGGSSSREARWVGEQKGEEEVESDVWLAVSCWRSSIAAERVADASEGESEEQERSWSR
jgi:hypothetical protein